MITKELFLKIKKNYGDVASWAVWEDEGENPKSNMGNIEIFDVDANPGLLDVLKNNIVMIGLNFSRPVNFTKPFQNFHDPNPHANDFKIRHAFKDTSFYGAYMTDVIKNTVIKSSQNMRSYLNANPLLVQDNINFLQSELECINAYKPLILAFGGDAYELLHKYLPKDRYSNLIKLTHYSHFISKEKYKIEVMQQINAIIN